MVARTCTSRKSGEAARGSAAYLGPDARRGEDLGQQLPQDKGRSSEELAAGLPERDDAVERRRVPRGDLIPMQRAHTPLGRSVLVTLASA